MTTVTRPDAAGRTRRLVARWWMFTARPMSLRAAWRLSGVVQANRIPPGGARPAAAVWWWSNRTDRLLLFALVILAPTVLTGPLLWCAARPTRRWGLYLVAASLVVGFAVAGG